MRTRLTSRLSLLFVACAIFIAVPVVAAFADNVVNDVTVSTDSKTITKGKSTTVKYWVVATPNSQDGNPTTGSGNCNAADGAPLTMRITAPSGVTVDGGSSKNLTFTGCATSGTEANAQSVTFASNTVGSYAIPDATYVSDANSPASTYNFGTSELTLKVAPFVSSTLPAENATGVATSANISANFSDAIDTTTVDSSTFKVVKRGGGTVAGSIGFMSANTRATLDPSANLDPGATYDVTVEGGDVGTAQDTTGVKSSSGTNGILLYQDSATSTINKTWSFTTAAAPTDTTAPVINSTLSPANADGSDGWYKSNVSLAWSVTDPESASSIVKTGCVDRNITSDQQATSYSCSATSAGGSSGPVSVSIKRDATAPTNVQFVGGPNAGGTYAFGNVPNEPTCTADDATSTVDTCVVTGYGNAVGGHTLTATATDKAGNKTTATRTYTVSKATAQVNLSNLTHTYDGTVKAASASTTPSGLNVDLAYSQNGSAATPKDAGDYRVVATVNNANYEGSASGTLSIARADQAISFSALANKTFGDANFNVSATGGNSGNAVTFTADGNCSVSGNTVQIAGAGSCTITASQAGNANYNAASPVERSFAIAKAQASINLSDLSKTYTGQAQGATVTTTPADLGGVSVTYDGSAQAPTNAGSYRVVASLTNPNYEAQNATGTLVIAKAKAGVTLSDLTHTYDGTVKAASASTTPSGLNVGFAYSQNGSPATPKNAGSYAVVATVNNANYEGSANGQLVIAKAQASINLSGLSKTYTGQAQGATVTTTPDVPNAQLTVTYDGSAQAPTNAGSYRVVASLNDANYEARDAVGTLVIAKAEATINLGGLSKTYTGQAQGATVTTTPTGLGGVSVTYDGSAQAPTNAGSYNVVASLTNPNYEAQNATGTLKIEKASAQVSLSGLSKTYTGQAQGATVTTTPTGLNVDVTYAGNAQAPTNAGSYAVVATVNNANYQGSANGTLVIDKASQVITFAPLADKILGADFNISATGGNSGNAVTFAAAGSCTISGNNTVSVTGVGSCTITASQAGDSNYNAAQNVTQSFNASYNFTGFASPVDNNNVMNSAKAGQAIPLKWRLTDANGAPVANLSSVKVTAASLNCNLGTTIDQLEEYAAGASALQNLGNGYYQFNWKSPTTYASSCKTLNVDMGEGAAVTHTALFKFTK